jgi:hypothetical protein
MRLKKNDVKGTAFADLVRKPRCLIEMKKTGTDLSRHCRQAFDYWIQAVPDRPRYVVLCNFDELWVYDFVLRAKLDEDEDDRLGEHASGWCVEPWCSRWRCDRRDGAAVGGPRRPASWWWWWARCRRGWA